ncbi:neurotransmitter:Na+ symporter, NSS family [Halopenitus malekzadehii]|uniref:Neurotransmitter:Na+ symporter, NSS family n=1 Tax=Halopenitus malekzadehii TaxID=1267564 RepID=A0A1H6IZ05_9EURY|nr:sodium-dependent transporter [Halopenitus malekzadehii]SEH51814.1 neurotransmitter:Na+ symporter, NSS family [Halopenitus malekzadehii]
MTRSTWRTRIGFILAAVGSAVGIGNIWRFPWLTAENGGAAFLTLYLVLVVGVGVPGLIGEFVIGRRSNRNPVGAFDELAGRWYRPLGAIALIACLVILSFYSVVGGWILRYTFASTTGAYFAAPQQYFAAIDYGLGAVGFHVLFLAATVAIVYLGVERGIELSTTVMVPGIVVLFGGLAVWVSTLPGAGGGYDFYLSLDVSYLRENFFSVLPAAAGQALFTLSVGAGTMLTYSSYLGEDRSLAADGTLIAVLNTAIGVLAGLVIFPLLFSLGVSPGQGGPGALFVSLAGAFAELPYSRLVGVVFFGVVLLAALSSAISILEVLVAYLVDEHDLSRGWATLGTGGIFLVTGTIAALSPSAFGLLADTLSNVVLTAGLIGFLLFDGWVLGRLAREEFGRGAGPIAQIFEAPWYYAIAVVLPVFLAFTLVTSVAGIVGIDTSTGSAMALALIGITAVVLTFRRHGIPVERSA